MLIRGAEIGPGVFVDLRVEGERIAALASVLPPLPNEPAIDAGGCALLPGLHDHHLHLRALAASLASVRCGPPQRHSEAELVAALREADAGLSPGQWLRGIAYHESVAGELDRARLDAWLPRRPLRVQHRSGRLWIFNSAALDRLAPAADAPLERRDGGWSGRLYDADDWLRARLDTSAPDLAAASRALAARGVTGVTDTTHHNGPQALQDFAHIRARGELLQTVRAMGDARLDGATDLPGVQRGEHKFHLHEHALPELDALVDAIRTSHAAGRGAAFHCVTRTELVFALAALREAGLHGADRIEHAAVAPPELAAQLAELALPVVTQPGFIAERGDHYLRDVAAADRDWLYRLRGLVEAGVPLALSTDAPFAAADPWAAMQAAMTRRTAAGVVLGATEALSAKAALDGFLTPLAQPGGAARLLRAGAPADLCLLDRGYAAMLARPEAVAIRLTMAGGCIVHDVARVEREARPN